MQKKTAANDSFLFMWNDKYHISNTKYHFLTIANNYLTY